MHVVQHLFGAGRPDFVVAAVAEEAHADDDVARKSQAFLRFQELILEAGRSAKGYDGVFADHVIGVIRWDLLRSKAVPAL